MQVIYPFAAIPNHIARGGHGAINIAVLVAMISHGRVTASIDTIAKEVGCGHNSVRSAIKYWVKIKDSVGMKMYRQERNGSSNIYKIEFTRMDATPTGSGRGGVPKTTGVPLPNQGHEEEQERRIIKNPPKSPKRGTPEKSFRLNTGLTPIGKILSR